MDAPINHRTVSATIDLVQFKKQQSLKKAMDGLTVFIPVSAEPSAAGAGNKAVNYPVNSPLSNGNVGSRPALKSGR